MDINLRDDRTNISTIAQTQQAVFRDSAAAT
jgi:hypothetical protein